MIIKFTVSFALSLFLDARERSRNCKEVHR